MRKFTTVLFMVFLVVIVTADSMTPNQALATNDEVPVIIPEEGVIPEGNLIMEQNGSANDGASGDPDSLGDGFGFIGDLLSGPTDDLNDRYIFTIEEYISRLLKQQLVPVQ